MKCTMKSLAGSLAFLLLPVFPAIGSDSGLDRALLADAVEAGDREAVRVFLDYGVNVNARQLNGMTALHWAVYRDDLKMVDQLLEAGADISATNRYGVAPISLACLNGNGTIVKRLLELGADPNATRPGGETALMTAARTGRIGAVRALLEHGAEVQAKEERRGQNALMWAAAEGQVEVVKELIAAGADYRERLGSGFTALLFAVRQGELGVVKALVEAGADVNETVESGHGSRRGYGGGPPRIGASALHLAVRNAHFELAGYLLDEGADPDPAVPGYTPLHLVPVVRKPGVGDNDPPPEGSGTMTSIEIVRKLVNEGADVNARMTKRVNLNNTRLDEEGATPFLLASLTADAELMQVLIDLGADPSITNDEESTPLMVAAGLATRSPGEDAGTEQEVLEAVKLLLELGADVNAVNEEGETAMHAAAYKNLPKVVEFLAANGADIEIWNRENKFGWTPLVIAQGYRHGNFKPSPPTVAAVERVMREQGVEPPPPPERQASAN